MHTIIHHIRFQMKRCLPQSVNAKLIQPIVKYEYIRILIQILILSCIPLLAHNNIT